MVSWEFSSIGIPIVIGPSSIGSNGSSSSSSTVGQYKRVGVGRVVALESEQSGDVDYAQ
jgi:hypothetical protein